MWVLGSWVYDQGFRVWGVGGTMDLMSFLPMPRGSNMKSPGAREPPAFRE